MDSALEHAWHVCTQLEKKGLSLTTAQVRIIAQETEKRDEKILEHHRAQLNDEFRELKEWIGSAEEPTGVPKYLSTKFYIAEKKRAHDALERALIYNRHMSPQDAELIRTAYNNEPFEISQTWKQGDWLRIGRYKQVWVVRQVVARGVVVSTVEKDDHRHLLEWDGGMKEAIRVA